MSVRRTILFLGQKKVGERCFRYLLENPPSGSALAGAFSNSRREVWWNSSAIHDQCRERGIPFEANEVRDDAALRDFIVEHEVDTLVSVQHPWIIPGSILQLARGGAFNIHNAKLPEYQGHNCCNHAILNGELEYACTLHEMTEDVDRGPILEERRFGIEGDETAFSLYAKAAEQAFELFRSLLRHLDAEEPFQHRQQTGEGVFYPRNSLDELRCLPAWLPPEREERLIRALYFPPFEPAYRIEGGRKKYLYPSRKPDTE